MFNNFFDNNGEINNVGVAFIILLIFGILYLLIFLYNLIKCYKENVSITEKYFNVKKISYISIFIAMTVSLTLLINYIFPISVIPPIRLSFEGILIKISGFLFGPLLGGFIAFVSDCLVLINNPSYIHWTYMLTIFLYGFCAGIFGLFSKSKFLKKNYYYFINLISFLIIVISVLLYFVFKNKLGKITLKFLHLKTTIKYKKFYLYCLLPVFSFIILFIWIIFFYNKYKKNLKNLNLILSISLLCLMSEFIAFFITSVGDWKLIMHSNAENFEQIRNLRLIFIPLKLTFNVFLLFITIKFVKKNFKF